jgi:hypothetical protein
MNGNYEILMHLHQVLLERYGKEEVNEIIKQTTKQRAEYELQFETLELFCDDGVIRKETIVKKVKRT